MSEARENSGNGRKLWPIILSAISVSVVLLTGAVTFISQIAALSIQNSQQTAEINSLKAQVAAVNDRQTSIRSRLDVMETRQKETETQFCAMDVIRNLMHANDMRVEAVLWRKVMDVPIPTDNAYYPTLCAKEQTPAP